jgi:endonuclease/exonuclease/phosphatase (EEP) superfamily protein YafD
VSLLVSNVLMSNRHVERFIALVQAADPDIILVLEPDPWWEEQLRVLEQVYMHTVKKPLTNRYGMLLYSKLRLLNPEIKFLIKKELPSIHTEVQLPSGQQIWLHCLHPEPPSPTEAATATKRDAELLIVGTEVQNHTQPVIVAGDLNDVAWSYTTTLFQKASGLLDPRIGRGMFNTFHANIPLMRWPLDHIFHSDHFLLVSIKRLPAFGSDHFPVYIQLSQEARAPRLQETPEVLQAEEKALVEVKIDKVDHREQL